MPPRVAIVTGGARGIGRAIAARMVASGWRVVVADIDGDAATETAAALAGPVAARPFAVDVRDRARVEAMVENAAAAFGRLDVLVANAGTMERKPFLEIDDAYWHRVLDINLYGAFVCGQAAARRMVADGTAGRIVNVTSNSGILGGRDRAAYGASKAGLINLTQSMAIELAEYGILVNAVAPGLVQTKPEQAGELPAAIAARMPLGRWGQADEVAALAMFLASEDCSFTTGHVFAADGGFTAAGIT